MVLLHTQYYTLLLCKGTIQDLKKIKHFQILVLSYMLFLSYKCHKTCLPKVVIFGYDYIYPPFSFPMPLEKNANAHILVCNAKEMLMLTVVNV